MKKATQFISLAVLAVSLALGSGNNLASFTGHTITNSSTQTGGGGQAPDAIAGLAAWYKTPISGGVNNSAISTWPDSAGSYTMSPGSAPTYKTSILNGYAVTDWSGSNQLSSAQSSSLFPMTFFAVVKWDGSSISNATIFGADGSGGIQFRVDQTTGTLTFNKEQVAAIGTSTGTLTSNIWAVVVGRVDSSSWKIWINGTVAGSGSHSQTLFGGHVVTMGVNGAGSNEFFKGQIAECGNYSTAVSDSDVGGLSTYLATKYGL